MISLLKFLSIYSSLIDLKVNYDHLDPMLHFKGSLFSGVLAGLLGGGSILLGWEKWLRNKHYGWALFSIFISYSTIFLVVSLISGLFFLSKLLSFSIFELELWHAVINEIFSLSTIENYFFWLVIVLGTLLMLQVQDKYGPGVFKNFLLGKYFKPKREERIFMFLDLRSSTTIAEQLGEIQYFNFIKDVFKDVTPAILEAKGEIYQYIGDEIIISWKKDKGLANNKCLNCFFKIQNVLLGKRYYYSNNYQDIQPVFKAGLHAGFVMVGEIGIVKRDIAYSGDVLNTTARIQGLCNEFNVDILISKYLLDGLQLDDIDKLPKFMGDLKLRGKQEKVQVFTI